MTTIEAATRVEKNTRRTGFELELYVAEFYAKKMKDCRSQGKVFTLTITEFKRLLTTKKCFYSGVALSHSGVGCPNRPAHDMRFSDLTLERLDCGKGYIPGNVKAVAHGFNKLKSVFENPTSDATMKDLYKFVDTLRKLKL